MVARQNNTNARAGGDTSPIVGVEAEYMIMMNDDLLEMFLDDPRVKATGIKTNCRVELTRRILNKRVGGGKWTKYAIVRLTGIDENAIRQCNTMLERLFPHYRQRKPYPKRADVSIYTRNTLPDNTALYYPYQRTAPTNINITVGASVDDDPAPDKLQLAPDNASARNFLTARAMAPPVRPNMDRTDDVVDVLGFHQEGVLQGFDINKYDMNQDFGKYFNGMMPLNPDLKYAECNAFGFNDGRGGVGGGGGMGQSNPAITGRLGPATMGPLIDSNLPTPTGPFVIMFDGDDIIMTGSAIVSVSPRSNDGRLKLNVFSRDYDVNIKGLNPPESVAVNQIALQSVQ